MRTAELLADEELPGSDSELSLGMGSLLGIFFGLALVCGVFFGFGYMMGHRTPGPYVSSEPLYVAPKPQPVAPKPSAQVGDPSAGSASVVVPTQSSGSPSATTPAVNQAGTVAPRNAYAAAPATQSRTPAPALVSAPVPAPPNLFNLRPAVASTGTIMVQIAAVKSRPDAEALAAALQKNGFSPTVRDEPQDKLLHVQVGPFSSRDDAKAMRQKLASAGYNAFIK